MMIKSFLLFFPGFLVKTGALTIEPITIEKSLHYFTQANRKPIMEKSEYFRLLGVPGLAG
ncbi:hypothetical protein [Heyndrickxia coagulans]|uniref:hypothetical protein n=1 Tax=Heyndrickxia coagulans TaxID=1398 RepID=UPI0022364F4F|nr:hypothetical protein [Heyndrickxia coagulans]UZH06975.1 hypothetical protein ONG97_03310 [Heyndrickxia coagulans]